MPTERVECPGQIPLFPELVPEPPPVRAVHVREHTRYVKPRGVAASSPTADGPGRVRRDGSSTSKAAALQVLPKSGTWRGKVLAFVVGRGEVGATFEEICRGLGRDYSNIGPRVRELVEGGWVEDSRSTRRGTSGSDQMVWRATKRALDAGV